MDFFSLIAGKNMGGGSKPSVKEYMEYDTAGTEFVRFSYYSAGTKTNIATKVNDGKAVVAGVYDNNMLTIYCIALNPQTEECAKLSGNGVTTFSYKGHAHNIGSYYVYRNTTSPASRESYAWTNKCETFELSDIGATAFGDWETIGTYILDYYYSVETDSGIELDHTVTFMVDGEPYEIVSVKDGNSVNAPATTSELGTVVKWLLDNQEVSFPYIPISNIALDANILTVHTEIELNNKGDTIFTWYRDASTGGNYTKTNDGWSIVGCCEYASSGYLNTTFILIAKTQQSSVMSGTGINTGTIQYNGETYYYQAKQVVTSYVTNYGKAIKLDTEYTDNNTLATQLLDYYYGVT